MDELNPQHEQKLNEAYRTAYLVAGFIRNTLTQAEREELDDWIIASDENMRLFGEWTDEENIAHALEAYDSIDTEARLAAAKQNLFAPRKRANIIQWAMAAVVLALVAAGAILLITRKPTTDKGPIAIISDTAPGTAQAILTVAGGKTITLATNSDMAVEGGSVKDNELRYEPGAVSETVYHTLTVPRKGKFRMLLADGTRVWLNAESSLYYPVAFNGSERRVTVTGEAYFEVAKDAGKPFRVEANGITTEVTGTSFNVHAYNSEPVNTTLVEGSVKLSMGASQILLQPGEQGYTREGVLQKSKVDVSPIIAWQQDEFDFRNADLEIALRQAERWYDVHFELAEKINVHLNARIERGVPLSRFIALLEKTKEIHFQIKKDVITVTKGRP